MILTDEMHDRVMNSPVGQFLDRLIREEIARGGNTHFDGGGNVIQALWAAFVGCDVEDIYPRDPTVFDSFAEMKQRIKDGPSLP